MLSLDESGEAKGTPEEIVKSKEFTQNYLPAPQTEDGKDYVLKQGRFGEFWAHPDYPKVKDAKPLELRPEKIEEMFGKPPETKEGKSYLLKKGKFGHFWAHPDYPKVKDIISIKKSKKEESKK
jgi:ssDNA-binding Zn-finger/Zn-ribbon topoisomerase 1